MHTYRAEGETHGERLNERGVLLEPCDSPAHDTNAFDTCCVRRGTMVVAI